LDQRRCDARLYKHEEAPGKNRGHQQGKVALVEMTTPNRDRKRVGQQGQAKEQGAALSKPCRTRITRCP
jgi:hypothetical protein